MDFFVELVKSIFLQRGKEGWIGPPFFRPAVRTTTTTTTVKKPYDLPWERDEGEKEEGGLPEGREREMVFC